MMSDSIGICKALHNQEDKLRQHSIYILSDDSDTDFDFYVLVSSVESPLNNENFKNEKNEFLKELFNFLAKANNISYKNFADETHRNQLREWIGEGVEDKDLTVLNWLKIAIEKYPYRLFVAVDNVEEYKNCKSKFIKKRICWIDKESIKSIKNKILSEFLYPCWLKWYCRIIRDVDLKKVKIGVGTGAEKTSPFYSLTSPSGFFNINITFETWCSISRLLTNTDNLAVLWNRHGNYVEGLKNNNSIKNYCGRILFSGSISGAQTMFPLFVKPTEVFKYLLIESSLTKIGVLDERFLEWAYSDSSLLKEILAQNIFPIYKISNGKNDILYQEVKSILPKFELNLKDGALRIENVSEQFNLFM